LLFSIITLNGSLPQNKPKPFVKLKSDPKGAGLIARKTKGA